MSSRRRTWMLFLATTIAVVALALSPPLFSPFWRAVVMHAFSPVCHQVAVRSPHLGGVQLAICDRCIGIYLGLVIGVASVGWGRLFWQRVGTHGRYVLLGSLLPLGMDWVGPVVGLWSNTPVSRAATGMVFGLVAASFATAQVLRRMDERADSA
ncbi:DUF2085 domain-containing protein [Salinibacter sp. 10B]|uniref:DUF2085 domain-containing protein n=1 Tax=Salinibacter sp. 10B TaxID=1923971 RepID=UPI0021577135|nr:DUF2085 domain-containing protein [Salinibacter sp. 10B]